VGTKEYLAPNEAAHGLAGGSASWSAAGQLTSSAASRGFAGSKEMPPSLFATRPLPNPLAQTSGDGAGSGYSSPSYGDYNDPDDMGAQTPPANANYPAGYGQVTSPMQSSWSQPGTSTAAYGQPALPQAQHVGQALAGTSAPGPATPAGGSQGTLPGTSYGASSAGGAAYGRNTIYGMPAPSWQPALPVSPWSTYDRGSGGLGGGANIGTETILSTDLKALRRSRLKAWTYLVVVAGLAGTGFYFGGKRHFEQRAELGRIKQTVTELESQQQQTLARNSVEAAANNALAQKSASGLEPADGGPSAATARLADELKKQLTGVAGLAVETRGERVVVSLDQAALFSGNQTDVGLGGYRMLYRFGKVLKSVPAMKDRRIVVTVAPDAKGKGARGGARAWGIASARAVSLGRFVIDDLSVEPHRVSALAPAVAVGRSRNIEFALEAMPVHSKS
jgi:flagellar motor protein MotB